MGCPLIQCLAAFLFMSIAAGQNGEQTTDPSFPDIFYPFWNATEVDIFDNESAIILQQPFRYFTSYENTIYVNKNGLLSFSMPLVEASPSLNEYNTTDLIAPLWTDFDYTDNITYQEVTQSGSLLDRATHDINTMFPGSKFYATWLFIATWGMLSSDNSTGNATFQAVLVSNDKDASYIIFNYGEIDLTDQEWLAGYEAVDGNEYIIPVTDIFNLSSTSNVHIPGRWAFQVAFPNMSSCESLKCAWHELCKEIDGVVGCACGNNTRPNPDIYDAIETCAGSNGSLSLSRCQLFEAGYAAGDLHLNDPRCRGEIDADRLVFSFDSNDMCGTVLESNSTHIIFKNNVGTTDGMGIISHVSGLNIAFSCVYPLIQSISMPMPVYAIGSVISKELSTEGMYHISMIPYHDPYFKDPFTGNVTLQVNHQLYIAVTVDQFDSKQIALVIDRCWATPVKKINYSVHWDLIVNDCPNPADGTVKVLQNGVSTSSYFSFRMFTFTGFPNNVFLHCQVHLCLITSGKCAQRCGGTNYRRRRSADFYDSAAITMEF